MALIQTELTDEQKIERTRAALDLHLSEGAKELYYRSQCIWKLFWANDVSCQAVFDSFGADALSMAKMLAQAKAMIEAISPEIWTLQRPGVVTAVLVDGQPNGHVTVVLNP